MEKKNRVAFFNILSTILLRGISFFTSPVFSRLLGTGGYGVLSAYNIWVSICAIVFSFYTHGSLINARVDFPVSEQKQYQSAAMSLGLFAFLGFSVAVVMFLDPVAGMLKMSRFLVILILLQSFGSFCVTFLNSKYTYEFKADKNMLVSVGVALSTLGLSLVFVLLMPAETRYIGRILGNAIVYGGLGIVICAVILIKGKTFIHKKYWKFCLLLCIPLAFQALSDLLLGHSDLLMIQQMRSDSEAGIYGYAYQFGGIMFTIFGALNGTWTPFFFEDMKNGAKEEVRKTAGNFLEVFTVLSVGFLLLTTEVFRFYARRDFWEGTGLIPLFVASYYIGFLCTFPVNFEYFHKKTSVVAVATIVSSLVNIVLNYFFILRMGMMGAALATMLSHCLQLSLHYGYCRLVMIRQAYPFGISLWGKYAAAFAAAAVLVWLTPSLWLPRWLLGAVVGIWELLRIRSRKCLI